MNQGDIWVDFVKRIEEIEEVHRHNQQVIDRCFSFSLGFVAVGGIAMIASVFTRTTSLWMGGLLVALISLPIIWFGPDLFGRKYPGEIEDEEDF